MNIIRASTEIKVRVLGESRSRQGWQLDSLTICGYDLVDVMRTARRESQGWRRLEFLVLK